MGLYHSSTFYDSLAKLDSRYHTPVIKTVGKISDDPNHPGLRQHKLNTSEGHFWSYSVNMDVRIIAYKNEDVTMLCYVDHHDNAYAWADRHVLEQNPETGAAQLVRLVERTEEVVQYIYKEVEAPLFERYANDYLLALGVPPRWLDAVKQTGRKGLDKLIDVLPEEAMERLWQLADGQPVPRPAKTDTSTPAASFAHPDAQRRFRIADSNQRLFRQALEQPWDKWLVFLHPSQQSVVERHVRGPARVSGGAGTGKTVVALHRTAHLAQQNQHARILLTTFSKTLSKRLEQNLAKVLDADEHQQVTTTHIHRLAKRTWEALTGKTFTPLTNHNKQLLSDAINTSLRSHGLHDANPAFIEDEWEQVIDAHNITTWDGYKKASRKGRGVPLSAKQRLELWSVFADVNATLAAKQCLTFSKLCHDLADHLSSDPETARAHQFDHIIADEIQDFTSAELRLLRALAPEGDNDLFLCGDMGQRIYNAPASFLASGVDIRGRSTLLKLNYRTTEQIRHYAASLLPNYLDDGDGNLEVRQTVSLLNGVPPKVQCCDSHKAELEHLKHYLQDVLEEGFAAHDIAIFARTNQRVRQINHIAQDLGLEVHTLSDDESPETHHLSVGTMHRAKGLEFKVVIVFGCSDGELPPRSLLNKQLSEGDRQEVIDKERNLLYVACTRARQRLLITGSPILSSLVIPIEAVQQPRVTSTN